MSDVRSIPLAGERFTSTQFLEVRSPYDNSLIGKIPACTSADVDRAVAVARAALQAGPMPLWRRAQILDIAAVRLTERREEFAQIISREITDACSAMHLRGDRNYAILDLLLY